MSNDRLIIIFSFFLFCGVLYGQTLHSICNFLGGDYVDYDYCVSAFSSAPEATSADGAALAVISVNLTAVNATAVKSLADSLYLSSDPSVRSSLRSCSDLYAAAVPNLKAAAAASSGGNYSGAADVLGSVLHVPAGCDVAFDRSVSPIRKENGAFSDLATLARAVNNYMAQ